jgi:hypothetical protein
MINHHHQEQAFTALYTALQTFSIWWPAVR